LTGLIKAFLDLRREQLAPDIPTIVGVQAQGCSPIAQAFASGKVKVERRKKAKTIVHAISNPDPPAGNIVLKLIRENKGMIITVSDEEILEAQSILAELEGIFCQPASATVLAGLLKLSKEIKMDKNDSVVLVITGSGLKAMESLKSFKTETIDSSLSDLESTIDSLLT